MEPNLILSGRGGDTFSITTDNSVQSIDESKLKDGEDIVVGAVITVEDNNLRYTLGEATPQQGSLGHLVGDGDIITLRNYQDVNNISWVNDVDGSQATLQITPLYN